MKSEDLEKLLAGMREDKARSLPVGTILAVVEEVVLDSPEEEMSTPARVVVTAGVAVIREHLSRQASIDESLKSIAASQATLAEAASKELDMIADAEETLGGKPAPESTGDDWRNEPL